MNYKNNTPPFVISNIYKIRKHLRFNFQRVSAEMCNQMVLYLFSSENAVNDLSFSMAAYC